MKKALGIFLVLVSVSSIIQCKKSTSQAKSGKNQANIKGKQTYLSICATCHGSEGAGDGIAGQALQPKARNFQNGKFKYGNDLNSIIKTINNGSPGTAMVGYKKVLKSEEIEAVAKYVITLIQTEKKPDGENK